MTATPRRLLIIAGLTASLAAGEAGGFTGELSLLIDGVLQQQRGNDPVDREAVRLHLDLIAQDGQWDEVWGVAPHFNQTDHRGRVISARQDGDRLRLEAEMLIGSDPWIQGGRALVQLDLRRAADGAIAGTASGSFTGPRHRIQFADRRVAGVANPRRQTDPGYVPLTPGEHPRLLFRRHELDAVRAKLRSPDGAAALQAIRHAAADTGTSDESWWNRCVALGLKACLEDDRAAAEAVKPVIAHIRKHLYKNGYNNLPHPWGESLRAIALAYDLCYHHWEPAYRDEIALHLYQVAERVARRPGSLSPKMNWAPGSNYQPGTRGGAGIVALALLGDRGDGPWEPRAMPAEPRAIAPVAALPAGVQATPLANGKPPTGVVWSGASLTELSGPFAALTAPGVAGQPIAGTALTWSTPPATAANDRGALDLKLLLGEESGKHESSLYSVAFTVDKPMWARLDLGQPAPTAVLSGQWVAQGDHLLVQPGTHTLLLHLRMGNRPWGAIGPTLTEVGEAAVRADTARQHERYQDALRDYRADRARWEQVGRPEWNRYVFAQQAMRLCERYFVHMMGDGGYQSEGETYTTWSSGLMLEYGMMHRIVLGRAPSARPNLTHFAQRYVMHTVFRASGDALSQSFNHGNMSLSPMHYARLFRNVPRAHQPAVLWAWRRSAGLKHDTADSDAGAPNTGDPVSALAGLLSVPDGMAPASPEGILPRTWAATGKGIYIMRNGWKDGDDIVVQASGKSQPKMGWHQPNGGSLRIHGLGHIWAGEGTGNSKQGERWQETIVWMPDNPVRQTGGTRAMAFTPVGTDGSATLAMDLGPVYNAMRKDAAGQDLPPALDWRWEPEHHRTDITARRNLAVDLSGTAGAPMALVLADRIIGDGRKAWLWQIPRGEFPVTVEDRRFVFTRGDASLVATLVAPADARFTRPGTIRASGGMSAGTPEKPVDVPVNAVAIESEGREFTAVVAVTLQRGPAPAVSGDGRSVRIGASRFAIADQGITLTR